MTQRLNCQGSIVKNISNLTNYTICGILGTMENTQRKFLDNSWIGYLKEQPDLLNLRTRLLSIGGEEVVPVFEDDLKKILNRGIPLINPIIKLIRGRPISCHSNSCEYWADHQKASELMTGWGLSEDGLWRQHSWVRIIKSGKVVETTIPRSIYYGFVMTPEEAGEFCSSNF